jgi:chorismate mutase/prephenate dehydratase
MNERDGRLRELRARIDRLDEEIQARIAERAQCAQDIAALKTPDGNGSLYRPEREMDVLRRVVARNRGPLANEEIARLFREIMSACLALESPLRVGYLGPPGTFTQAAALKHFGHSVTAQPLGSIADVFREVEAGSVNFGVVPIENSTEGIIKDRKSVV